MFVAESRAARLDVLEAFRCWRTVPTARRVIAAHWSLFLADAPALRGGMAKGKYDAYLLMPRGARDEEFHTAVCELLSDWGSTVAEPEVVTVRIVSPVHDALTLAIRDFLDRMGMPNRVYTPDSEEGRDVIARAGGTPTLPPRRGRRPARLAPTSVRDVALRIYGAPSDIELDEVVDVADRRRRPGGPRGRGLRLVRGAEHRRARGGGRRRPGRHVAR